MPRSKPKLRRLKAWTARTDAQLLARFDKIRHELSHIRDGSNIYLFPSHSRSVVVSTLIRQFVEQQERPTILSGTL